MSEIALNFELACEPVASSEARRALAPLREFLPVTTLDDLALVVSELTANSAKHGPGAPIEVQVNVAGDRVTGVVDDGGAGGPQRTEAHAGEGQGLGLMIVDALSERWGVKPGTSRVWFEIGLRSLN